MEIFKGLYKIRKEKELYSKREINKKVICLSKDLLRLNLHFTWENIMFLLYLLASIYP